MLEKHGSRINWRALNDQEFDQQLRIKIVEEAEEVGRRNHARSLLLN